MEELKATLDEAKIAADPNKTKDLKEEHAKEIHDIKIKFQNELK